MSTSSLTSTRRGRRPGAESRELWARVCAYLDDLNRKAETHTVGSVTPAMFEREFGVSAQSAAHLLERVVKTFPNEWKAERFDRLPWQDGPVLYLRSVIEARNVAAASFARSRESHA